MFFKLCAPKILEADLDLVPDMVVGGAGDHDPARLRNAFKARRDIDAVAIEIAALDHDITEIDTDAQHDVAILGQIAVGGGHASLQLDRTLHGIDRAAELDQHAIAGHLENPALVPGDQRLQHLLASRLESRQRAGFVLAPSAGCNRLRRRPVWRQGGVGQGLRPLA